MTLTPARKRTLRGKAHHLKPIVLIGDKGLTETVLKEIDRALFDHELIKIKISGAEKEAFRANVQAITSGLTAELVQIIGHTVVLYRKSDKV